MDNEHDYDYLSLFIGFLIGFAIGLFVYWAAVVS